MSWQKRQSSGGGLCGHVWLEWLKDDRACPCFELS